MLVEKQCTQSLQTIQTIISDLFNQNGFGILHIHDLGTTLRNKSQDFKEQLFVYEVCNPVFAAQALKIDIRINAGLPCRFSVYTINDRVHLSFIKPTHILQDFSDDPELSRLAQEVELRLQKVFDAID